MERLRLMASTRRTKMRPRWMRNYLENCQYNLKPQMEMEWMKRSLRRQAKSLRVLRSPRARKSSKATMKAWPARNL